MYEQLSCIYKKRINAIMDIKDDNIENEDFLKHKLNKLKFIKNDILNGYGHGCDKMLDSFLKDINDKIEITNNKCNEISNMNYKKGMTYLSKI